MSLRLTKHKIYQRFMILTYPADEPSFLSQPPILLGVSASFRLAYLHHSQNGSSQRLGLHTS